MIELPPCPYVGGFPQDSNRDFLERFFRLRLVETFAVGLVFFRGSGRWPATTPREWEALCDASADLTPVRLKSLRRFYPDPALFALLCACAEYQLACQEELWKRLDRKPLALKLVLLPQLAGVQPGADDMKALEQWAQRRFDRTTCRSVEDVEDRTQDAFEAALTLLQAGQGSDRATMTSSPPVFPLPLAPAEATTWETLIPGTWPQCCEIAERLAPALDAKSLSVATQRDLIDAFLHRSRNPLSQLDSTTVVDEKGRENAGFRSVESRLDLEQLLRRTPIPPHVLQALLDGLETPDLTWEEAAKRHGTTRQTINKYLVRLRGAARKSS